MRYFQILETTRGLQGIKRGTFTPEQARETGSCAVIALSHITGLTWEQVWEHAKKNFHRYGMNAGDIAATARDLGWTCSQSYWKLLGLPHRLGETNKAMTVRQAETYLAEHDPNIRLICTIMAGGVPHSIAFADGKFHNVLGAYKAQIRLASIFTKQ